jgi:hypothetical protein
MRPSSRRSDHSDIVGLAQARLDEIMRAIAA